MPLPTPHQWDAQVMPPPNPAPKGCASDASPYPAPRGCEIDASPPIAIQGCVGDASLIRRQYAALHEHIMTLQARLTIEQDFPSIFAPLDRVNTIRQELTQALRRRDELSRFIKLEP